ncbi:MAG: ASKHA domain-containing protein, partial [Planctomycetota bacterium]|nr:ASKHA domain-containing protein [Planctomycetota bacterium]
MPRLVFTPSGRTVEVAPGTSLLDACRQAGFFLPSPCGGAGLCGKCRVRIVAGEPLPAGRPEPRLSREEVAAGWRSSCLLSGYGDLVLADPGGGGDGVALGEFLTRPLRGKSGLWEREAIPPPPSEADRRDDQARLLGALGGEDLEMELPLLAELPGLLRRSGFRCRALGLGRRVLSIRGAGGGSAGPRLGLAVDLGTTTLAGVLCDLDRGGVLAAIGRENPQRRHGDDVISRIEYASRGEWELAELGRLAGGAIEELAAAATAAAGLESGPILVGVAGNPAMIHLLLGLPPGELAKSPFVPVAREFRPVSADRLGWRGRNPPLALTVPGVSAFVGGDLVAGLLAHDLDRLEGSTLFLDIGTNGEAALAAGGKILACAAAAGPAFEGARIAQGMRAAPGAVCSIRLGPGGGFAAGVIGGAPAAGLCGTGLLDAVAALRRAGIIDPGGRLLSRGEAAGELPGLSRELAGRLHENPEGTAFWLVPPDPAGMGGVALTQADVREFQLAKGALAAGIRLLLATAGVRPEALDRVLLAGGFGSYLDPASALATGLLPAGVPGGRVRPVGNAALAGSR